MDAVADPAVEAVIVMKSAQVGWTEILANVVGYHIDQDPSPILLIQPTLDMGNTWSKDRLAPMLRDTPVLRGKVADPRARDSGNTILHKSFPGGHITIAGANSPAGLASRPIRIVLCDEVDRYPPSAGKEGDPINLARKRLKTFWNRKFLAGSTPTVKGASRIESLYKDSDMRRFHVDCPDCGAAQPLEWSNVKWPKVPEHQPEKAEYMCRECGSLWDDVTRWAAIAAGHWVAEKEFNGTAGFHLNEIYSPWATLADMATSFLEARKLPETLQTFINTSLGESWEMLGAALDADPLFDRREVNDTDQLPAEAVVLTAGLDTQDDRIEMEVVAWGRGLENWSVDYLVFLGDPDSAELWAEVDRALKEKFETEDGRVLRIVAACIDSGGHHSQSVYDFCKNKKRRRVFAVRGVGGQGKTIWPIRAARTGKGRGIVYNVGVDAAKQRLYGWLTLADPGPGYCHFPMNDRRGNERYDKEHFDQLAGEQAVTKYSHGRPVITWEVRKGRERVEALDCRVYAICALEAWAQPKKPLDVLEQRAKKIEKSASAERPAPAKTEADDTPGQKVLGEDEAPPEAPAAGKSKRKRRRPRSGGFVKNW